MKRRKLGHLIKDPIDHFLEMPTYDRLIFVEQDKAAAQKTRAAALMYIGRNEVGHNSGYNNGDDDYDDCRQHRNTSLFSFHCSLSQKQALCHNLQLLNSTLLKKVCQVKRIA